MCHAVCQAVETGHCKVVVIGTDIPDLSAAILEEALSQLNSYDAVFGPADDGGFYLFGLRSSPPPGLFRNIAWSTSAVLEQSLAAAKEIGLSVAPLDSLPKLRDIDTVDDLKDWIGMVGARDISGEDDRRLVELATKIVEGRLLG